MELKKELAELVFDKAALKKKVYQSTKDTFELFRKTTRELIESFQEKAKNDDIDIAFEFKDRGDFEFEVKNIIVI